MGEEDAGLELKTSRIESLSDNVYAFSMTLLIFGFEFILAQPREMTGAELSRILFGLWPDFIHYVIGFLILGAFWMEHHHQFHFIKRTDSKLLFLNIIGLMFIALIPFSTVIVGNYGQILVAALLFEVNLLVAGLIMSVHWLYASGKHRLVDSRLDPCVISFYGRRNLVIPAISLFSIGMSLLNPRFGTIFYITVPFILIWYKMRHPSEKSGKCKP